MSDPIITYRWPRTWAPRRVGMYPLSGMTFSISKYTGKQRSALGGATPWIARFEMPTIEESDSELDWKKIRALLMRVSGTGNRIALFDPYFRYPRGMAAGINIDNFDDPGTGRFSDNTLFSDGTGFSEGSASAWLARDHRRGEREVYLKGLVPSQTESLVTSDEMEIAGFKHSMLATVRSNADGYTLAPIHPPLRVDVTAASLKARVSFVYPTSPFVLSDPGYAGFDVDPPGHASIGLTFVEDLP